MGRKKRWTESPINNGIGTVKLFSWKYFLDYIYQEMLDYEEYIWRGQRNSSWILEPTLDRLIKNSKFKKDEITDFRKQHLERFKFAARGRRGSNPAPITEENEWWALAQHNGLATPLLDWTHSPFVAAYFSFIDTGTNQSQYRVIYALHKPSIELKSNEAYRKEEKEYEEKNKGVVHNLLRGVLVPTRKPIEFIKPLSDDNARLVNQNGLFSRSPDGVDLEQWAKTQISSNKSYTIMKILIPNKDRNDCLRTLNRMNINHLTLFPDLYGASVYCNTYAEIKGY